MLISLFNWENPSESIIKTDWLCTWIDQYLCSYILLVLISSLIIYSNCVIFIIKHSSQSVNHYINSCISCLTFCLSHFPFICDQYSIITLQWILTNAKIQFFLLLIFLCVLSLFLSLSLSLFLIALLFFHINSRAIECIYQSFLVFF